MIKDKRIFWVVDCASVLVSREIFLTRDEAEKFADSVANTHKGKTVKVLLSTVENWYFDESLQQYNYDDCSNTFDDILTFTTINKK